MAIITTTLKQVKIQMSMREWEVYTEACAEALSAAATQTINKALAMIAEGQDLRAVQQFLISNFGETQIQWADDGALDSEPFYHFEKLCETILS